MQHPFLWLLPWPDSIGVRLAMLLLAMSLGGVVLLLLTALDMAGLAPVEMKQTYAWVVICASVGLLAITARLWRLVSREILRPLQQINTVLLQELQVTPGLGQVADAMRELQDTVQRTQAELDESNRNLRHVEKLTLVGKLAAGVAHSVRNPLTSVKIRLFSLERGLTLTAQQQEDFAVISDAIRHVDGIVSNFLEFARRPSLTLEKISPSRMVDAALRLLESRTVGHSVTLTLKRKGLLPDVYADPKQFGEALLNILLNACEAMCYSGALRVEERVFGVDEALFAVIHIQDSGSGIPAKDLPDIFTPFFSTKEQGTGLGLPIAREILEEHGGHIEVQPSSDGGALFVLWLPVAPATGFFSPPKISRRYRPDIAAPE